MLNRRVQPVIHSSAEATCCAIAFKKVVCGELARVDGAQTPLIQVMLVSKPLGPFFHFKVKSDAHNFFFLAFS